VHTQKWQINDISEQSAPSSDPGSEWSPFLAGELGAPVVEATGGRVGGADLRHGQGHAAVEHGHREPPERHGHRAAVAQARVVCYRHAHHHGDDRKGQGEVGENAASTHGVETFSSERRTKQKAAAGTWGIILREAALELLLVAQLVQPGAVRIGGCRRVGNGQLLGAARHGHRPLLVAWCRTHAPRRRGRLLLT